MSRFVLFTIASLLQMAPVHNQIAYEVDLTLAVEGKALFGSAFLNLSQATILDCFEHCLKNCLCLAFQMCPNPQCQLLSSTRGHLAPSELRLKAGCTYYELSPRRQMKGINGHASKCAGVNCCEISKPCLNGGRCELGNPEDPTLRFRCKCPDRYGGRQCETCLLGYGGDACQTCASGFTGERCERCKIRHVGKTCDPITSCRGYNNALNHTSGIHKIFDANSDLFDVYCNFDKNSSMSWTLISSYKFAFYNNPNIKWSFVKDKPADEDNPNWNMYRLSKSRMKSIQQDSSKWRITCDYQSAGVVFKDYVRASNDKVDILTYNGKGCLHVEYIDIRGQHCSDCTAKIIQSHNRDVYEWYSSLHSDSRYTNRCDFKPTESLSCSGKGEDNFGFYNCANPHHRCSATENSTTQIWFGGE